MIRFPAAGVFVILLAATSAAAGATGTLHVQQHDKSAKTYSHVTIKVNDSNLALMSKDGVGTLVVGKSSCTHIKSMVRCLPYDAILTQYGNTYHIRVKSGTVWVNPAQRTVRMSMETKAGTSVSLTGTIDELHK